MVKLDEVLEINAPVDKVWDILIEPAYTSKLYPSVVLSEASPPGKSHVGTKFHVVGKVGRRKVEIYAEITEMVEKSKIVTKQNPGGMFRIYESTVRVSPKGKHSEVSISFVYELSMGYIGKVFNTLVLERLVQDNLKAYARNLKEFSELVTIAE